MSIPPVPNHPPRPGRRKPAEESPDSITTQLFIGQDKSADADGSTQALSPEELERLRSMVSSDGAEATEVLSLEELRQLAAADEEEVESGSTPRRARSEDIAEAQAASAPKQWNPLGGQAPSAQASAVPPPPGPHQGRWGSGFGAAGNAQAAGHGPGHPGGSPGHPGGSSGGGTYSPVYAAAGPAAGGYAAGYGPGGPAGPAGPGGPGGPVEPGGPGSPGGPGGPYRPEPETNKVPAWLWVLAVIALVLAFGIVGYIVWDSTQGPEETTSSAPTQEPSVGSGDGEDQTPSESSSPPVAEQTFSSPSGNIACTIDSERTRCVIEDYEYSPPEKPEDCQLDEWGAIVVANQDGAGFSCVEAPQANGPTRVLGYGESITASGMTCTSTKDGMTCKSDESGVGFNIRRASVDFLD